MEITMTIQEYLSNPMGKGSSALMLSTIRQSLNSQYVDLQQRMSVKWYSLSDILYVAHVKIPSRKHDKLFYDVLLQFDISTASSYTINDANMTIFSNCPSFTYTYAYVYNDRDELIHWCKPKYNRNILKKKPENRNPDAILNYERSIYLACRYLSLNSRNYLSRIKAIAVTAKNTKIILSDVKTNDEIESLYQGYSATIKKEKDNKSESKKTQTNKNPQKPKSSGTKTPHQTKTTKKTTTTSKTRHTKTVKKSN